LGQQDFLNAEQRLLTARLAYQITRNVNNRAQNSTTSNVPVGLYNRTHCGTNQGYHLATAQLTNLVYGCVGDDNLSDAGQKLYEAAQAELDDAQKAYNDLLSTQGAKEVLEARAQVAVAQEQYYAALDELRKLRTGEQSPSVTAAQSVVDQAQAAYDQSQKAIEQAKANLSLLDAQIAKLTIYAPMDGVVLARNVEPGEFIAPGGAAFSMAKLSELTITVYVAEDNYGKIFLGQKASVTVDSFPGQTFDGQVTFISDQAEFTPRNVQTVEGRSSTVYAIKLKVSDPQGQLKLGMPADVVFISK
jgi:HlyD family secretion protein